METKGIKTLRDFIRRAEEGNEKIILNCENFIVIGKANGTIEDKGFTIINSTVYDGAILICKLIGDFHENNKRDLGDSLGKAVTMSAIYTALDYIVKSNGITKQELFDYMKDTWIKGCE